VVQTIIWFQDRKKRYPNIRGIVVQPGDRIVDEVAVAYIKRGVVVKRNVPKQESEGY